LLSASHHSGRYSNSGRKKITTSAKNGIIANDRTSTLLWPKQARPPDQAWALWRNCLRILEPNDTLIKPLGKWTQPTHQKWSWFKNPHATSLCHRYGDNSWKIFPGSSHTGTRTRLNHIQYSTQESLPIIRPPSGLYPCTPKYRNKSTRNSFTVVCSSSPLIEEINLSTHSTTSYGTHPHPYFRYMLNLTSLTTIPTLAKIATEVQSYKLFIITDGSYDYMTKQGSHAIAITNNKKVLWLGAGPCIGNDIAMNPKRAELCGLASALYLALWICLDQEIHYGSITFLCDSKRAVNTLRDISQCLPLKHPTNDIDLALECRTIIKKLPIKAYFNWLPGHKKADDVLSKIQRDVHTAAKSCNKIISPSPTVLPPSYEIAIGLQRKIISTDLKGIVNQVAHETEIRNTIMKNTGWTLHQFQDIDWRAHQKAFCSIGRFRQISICKIIHGLLCTNNKQKRYYGKTDLCPCCESSTETMNHMLCCPSQYAT
jgi:hypothetical protein